MNESGAVRTRRPWLAAVLAVVLPGLGHVYARAWARALLWFVLFSTSIWFLLPDDVLTGAVSVGAFSEIYSAEPSLALFLLAISVMNVLDAYLTTTRQNYRLRQQAGHAGQQCPHCGKELDDDIEFCHWCTTRIEQPEEQ